MQRDKQGSILILAHVGILLVLHHFSKMLSVFHYMVLASLSKIKCPYECGFILGSLIHFDSIDQSVCFCADNHVGFLVLVCLS